MVQAWFSMGRASFSMVPLRFAMVGADGGWPSWCFVEAKCLDITKDQFAPDISAVINIIGKLGL